MSFGADGDLVFRSLEEKTSGLARIQKAGGSPERITALRVTGKLDVSPDGAWVIVHSPGVGNDAAPVMLAVPLKGGAPRKICDDRCGPASWSLDGRFLYVHLDKTVAIPVPTGKSLPDLPASGISSAVDASKLAGVRVIEQANVFPGPNPATYLFQRTEQQRNLFRIPLH